MTKELEIKSNLPATQGFDRFIEMAIHQPNFNVDALERLLNMQKDIMAANAKADYDSALSLFQKECPIIHKGKSVMNKDGKTARYSYAPMDSIISQVREPLAKHGFSYDVDTEIVNQGNANWIKAIVTATHVSGHSKTKTFMVPVDKDAFMNEQQKVAAARTYALRYCFTGIFGIMTGDEDDDTTSIEHKTTEKQTTPQPEPSKAKPSQSAPQPPAQKPDGKLTAKGLVGNLEPLPMPKKPGSFRYKITVDKEGTFYTFDKKIANLVTEKASTGPATITYHVGEYGKDIDTLTFEESLQDGFKKDFCGPENA